MIDFAVVGGGIAGLSAAAYLAPHGTVKVFEMESSLGYHTTGRSAAMLVENYGSAGSRPLVRAARSFLENPPDYSVDSNLLSPRAVMWVASAAGIHSLNDIVEKGQASGASSGLMSPEEALANMPLLDPEWLAGAVIEPSGSDIDVAALHQAFVRIARHHGAEVAVSNPVTAIERSASGWTVRSEDKSLEARAIVNASGAWGDRVASMAGVAPIGLQPYRRTAFMVPGSIEYAELPMIVEVGENWYLRPDGVQLLCSLAEETPSEPMDAKPMMEDVALAIDRINEATTLGIRSVNSQWAGLRTFSPDRDLVIGEDPTAPGFFWLVGQGGIGIQTAPAYGSLIATLATSSNLSPDLDAAGVDPSRTSPARFRRRDNLKP